jgi:hypothetical protein
LFFFKANSTSCNEYITETINEGDKFKDEHPYMGSFIPKDNISLAPFDNEGPYYVFLQVNIIDLDPSKFNDTAQKSYFRVDAYGSGKIFFQFCLY